MTEQTAPHILCENLTLSLAAHCVANYSEEATARDEGASDLDIHDTVLIAAAFCMYNRYVDGLATWQPRDPGAYAEMGARMAGHGYSAGG